MKPNRLLTPNRRQRWYAHAVFYPTWGWNLLLGRVLKWRPWYSEIDEHVLLGARPLLRDLPALKAANVGGIVNTCEEFCGHSKRYADLGMEQFYMPTTDFTHPSRADIDRALEFINKMIDQKKRVYVHCKAGRARSATVVMAYLMSRKGLTGADAQALLLERRPHVNRHLMDRPVLKEFEKSHKGGLSQSSPN